MKFLPVDAVIEMTKADIALQALFKLDSGINRAEYLKAIWGAKDWGMPKEDVETWARQPQDNGSKSTFNQDAFDTDWKSDDQKKEIKSTGYSLLKLVKEKTGWEPKPGSYEPSQAVTKTKAIPKLSPPVSTPVVAPGEAAELAAQKAELKELWGKYLDTAKNHDYANKKGAGNLADLRVVPEGMPWAGYLAIAHRDTLNDIVFIQYRSPKGDLKGKGKQHSAYYAPEPLHDNPIIKTVYVAEGLGALVAMRKAFINAFHVAAAGKDRFTKVGQAIHDAFPDMEIIFVPDTGAAQQAKAAARLVGDHGWYVKPPEGKPDNYGPDDLYNDHGEDALIDVCAKRYQPAPATSTASTGTAEPFTFVTSKEFVASMVIQPELVERMLAKSGLAMVYGPSSVG